MNHIIFMVEEQSAETAIQNILPRLLGDLISFQIHPFQGKDDLLKNLLYRLRAFYCWLPDDWGITVLIDEDRENCKKLKRKLEQIAQNAGFFTSSRPDHRSHFQVLNRIAIEELEAWFFGDPEALNQAYPRISPSLYKKAKYRNPDAIKGGTWEALERELQRVGYFRGGLAKIEAARNISSFMDPDQNQSKSFQVFRDGLRAMIGQ
jgi:hypothetical protein